MRQSDRSAKIATALVLILAGSGVSAPIGAQAPTQAQAMAPGTPRIAAIDWDQAEQDALRQDAARPDAHAIPFQLPLSDADALGTDCWDLVYQSETADPPRWKPASTPVRPKMQPVPGAAQVMPIDWDSADADALGQAGLGDAVRPVIPVPAQDFSVDCLTAKTPMPLLFQDHRKTAAGTAAQANPVTAPIDWAVMRRDDRGQGTAGATAAASGAAPSFPQPANLGAQAVLQTRLPVLIPTENALALDGDRDALLFPEENFYTLSISTPDILVEVFSTRLTHASAPGRDTSRQLQAVDEDGYSFAQTEFGLELSFNRYGAAYSVSVECAKPDTDARCIRDDYVRQVAGSLLIAAGRPARSGE